MTNKYSPGDKEIQFIDSHYKDSFHIPDGSCMQTHYPDETVVKPCILVDEYHTQVGCDVFHICQSAEIVGCGGTSHMAEPGVMGNEAAWRVGEDRTLAVQTCEDSYDYTLLDKSYSEIDGGQIGNPELSTIEIHRDILESLRLEHRELWTIFYKGVMEQVSENGRPVVDVPEKRESIIGKLIQAGEKAASSSHSHKLKEPERRRGHEYEKRRIG